MNVLETEWWTLLVPPEWWAEAEEDSILVGDVDDVGCIEISTLHKKTGEFSEAELRAIAEEESPAGVQWQVVTCGDLAGLQASFVEEDAAIREWYLASGGLMLFITYSCDEDNRGMDDAAVDEILDTLHLVSST